MVRRSSFAIAAALTSVALTSTAAVSLTGNSGSADTAAGTERTAPSAVVDNALATDPEVRSASEKATAVLTDADYVTREGDLDRKDRKRVRAAAQDLRAMLEQAGDATGTAFAAARPAPAASRNSERTSLSERAADSSGTTGGKSSAKSAAGTAPSPSATEPTNLASATPISEQGATELPRLDTPLAGLADSVAGSAESADSSADSVDAAGDAQEAGTKARTKKPAVTTVPSATDINKATKSLQRLITKTDGDAVVSVKAGPTPAEIKAAKEARAARAAERAAVEAREKAAARAAEAKQMAEAAKRYGNGQIPSDVLCGLSWERGHQLRCDATAALEDLNKAFRAAFGRNLAVTDGYRSYADQVSVAASKGGLAAVPGTSNHGLGQAVDLSGGIESFGSAEHAWMVANAGKYGWKHPGWAQAGGSKPEAWHWEYGVSY